MRPGIHVGKVLRPCWSYVEPSCDPTAHGNHILWPCASMLASERLHSRMRALLKSKNTKQVFPIWSARRPRGLVHHGSGSSCMISMRVVVGISGRTLEFPVERPNLRSNVRISGRTFKIQNNGTSEKFSGSRNFRSNVRNSGRTFKIQKVGHPKNEVPPPKIMSKPYTSI